MEALLSRAALRNAICVEPRAGTVAAARFARECEFTDNAGVVCVRAGKTLVHGGQQGEGRTRADAVMKAEVVTHHSRHTRSP